jgi:hypothetical protein
VVLGALVAALSVVASTGPAPASVATPTRTRKPAIATAPFTETTDVALADTPSPWPLPADATPYIKAAGLTVLGEEQLEVHYHAHLDVVDAGQKVTVPAGVGFVVKNGRATGITVLHTHDTSGVIHIESAKDVPYTLGQFFTEWGVALNADQVGGLHADADHVVQTYVNGRRFDGDPGTIRLRRHLEIALWYGPTGEKPVVPKSYRFPAGL